MRKSNRETVTLTLKGGFVRGMARVGEGWVAGVSHPRGMGGEDETALLVHIDDNGETRWEQRLPCREVYEVLTLEE